MSIVTATQPATADTCSNGVGSAAASFPHVWSGGVQHTAAANQASGIAVRRAQAGIIEGSSVAARASAVMAQPTAWEQLHSDPSEMPRLHHPIFDEPKRKVGGGLNLKQHKGLLSQGRHAGVKRATLISCSKPIDSLVEWLSSMRCCPSTHMAPKPTGATYGA